MNDHFSASFARALRGPIARAIVDDENVIESFPGSANNVPDMFLILVRRNDCGGLRPYVRYCHVESFDFAQYKLRRDISVLIPEI